MNKCKCGQCYACIAVYIYCPLKITQHTAIFVKIAGNKSEYTLNEHVKTVSKVAIFCVISEHHCYLALPQSSWAWSSPEQHRLFLGSSSTSP